MKDVLKQLIKSAGLAFFVFLAIFFTFQGQAFALCGNGPDCSAGQSCICDEYNSCACFNTGGGGGTTSSRSFAPILDFLGRTLNFILGLAGSIFAIMFFVGAIKYAMALGDPKGLQGAKDTLTLAIIGLFVVVGAFTLISLITSILGISGDFIVNPIESLREKITEFMNKINACNRGELGCDFGITQSLL